MGTREIALTQGQTALVDDADFDRLIAFKWTASRCHGTKFVAVRRENKRTVYMHRMILGLTPGDGLEADHINHDTLDNRRTNLRVVTPHANKRHQPSRGGSSKYVGVTLESDRKTWRAQIQVGGVMYNLGRYPTEAEAASARDAYVQKNRTGHQLNSAA